MTTDRLKKVVSISGCSGAGKTTLVSDLVTLYGGGRVQTITTRPRRPNESEDAYHFLRHAELDRLCANGSVLWEILLAGHRYAVAKDAVLSAGEANGGVAFVIITPDYHQVLSRYCSLWGIAHIALHLQKPSETEQCSRLTLRGDEAAAINRAVAEAGWFEAQARLAAEQLPLIFIDQGPPLEMFDAVLGAISCKPT